MCNTKTCPVKLSCFRHIAKAAEYQSFCDFTNLVTIGLNGHECRMFISGYKITTSNKSNI